MSSVWIAGIDPGKGGAIALLDVKLGRLVVFDMPRVMVGPREGVDADGVSTILQIAPIRHLVLEEVHSMPRDGHVGAFSFGRSRGVIEGAVAALGIPLTLVRPQVWKRAMHTTSDKDVSRARASQLFPACSGLWTAKSHDGRAEAALLALYGALTIRLTPAVKVVPHELHNPSSVKVKALKRAA